MKIVNVKSGLAEKKLKKEQKETPKKKTFATLDEFPEDVQKKARASAKTLQGMSLWNLGFERAVLCNLSPRRKENIEVKSQTLRDVGGYNGSGGMISTLINTLHKFSRAALRKGATELRVQHHHVVLTAWRKETDAEFQKRVTEVKYERAKLLAIRETLAEIDKEEKEQDTLKARLEQEKLLSNLINSMGVTKIQQALDRRRTPKKGK